MLHVVVKVKNLLSVDLQLTLATGRTLVSSILPCLKLLKNQKATSMANAMVGSALAFFLFSFQVHEKQALLFAVPASLLLSTNFNSTLFIIHTAFFRLEKIKITLLSPHFQVFKQNKKQYLMKNFTWIFFVRNWLKSLSKAKVRSQNLEYQIIFQW